jgi:hypothetical protein
MRSFTSSFGAAAGPTRHAACFVAWSLIELGRAEEAMPVLGNLADCTTCPPKLRAVTSALLAHVERRDERARALAAEARAWAAGLPRGYRDRLEGLLTRAQRGRSR